MKRLYHILFIAALAMTATAGKAQVVTGDADTPLDTKWSEPSGSSARSNVELYLDGKSTIKYTWKNTTSLEYDSVTYYICFSVLGVDRTVKAQEWHYFDYHKDKNTIGYYTATRSGNNVNANKNGTFYPGNTVDCQLTIDDGADDDYVSVSIYGGDYGSTFLNGSGSSSYGVASVILSSLSTSTRRYDIYDDKPLFTVAGETDATDAASILSNRIVDRNDAISVYVHRSLKSGTWSTLCLPFDVKVKDMQSNNALGSDVKIAEFSDVDVAGNIVNFHSIADGTETLKAGTPYLIYYNGDDKDHFFAPHVTFTQDGVRSVNQFANRQSTKQNDGYYFEGLLEPYGPRYNNTTSETIGSGKSIIYISTEKKADGQHLKKLSANGNLKAFRAYLVYPSSGATATAMTNGIIDIDGELNGGTTSVVKIMMDGHQVSNSIYNLQGQCVGSDAGQLPNGIYIRNGKKFIVR